MLSSGLDNAAFDTVINLAHVACLPGEPVPALLKAQVGGVLSLWLVIDMFLALLKRQCWALGVKYTQ